MQCYEKFPDVSKESAFKPLDKNKFCSCFYLHGFGSYNALHAKIENKHLLSLQSRSAKDKK